jgi:effector-binding domain-containing protein
MNIDIIEKNFSLVLYGVSGVAVNKNWGETGSRLMDEMWKQVKACNLKHKGMNVWVYEENNKMFTGIEPQGTPENNIPLELKNISLPKYAYYKHIGPYSQLREAGSKVLAELARRDLKTGLPYIEIYGHWTADETKLETELLWGLK